MKKKYTIFGNCQTTALNMYLNENKYFHELYEYQPVKLVHLISKHEVEELRETFMQCDLIIYQHIADNYHISQLATSRLLVGIDAQFISFPSLYFNAYFPHLDVMNGTTSVLNAVHDYNILCGYLFSIDENSLFNLIQDETFYSKDLSSKLLENALSELVSREKLYTLDIKVDTFIKNNYKDHRLFHQFNHPSRKIFEYIREEIFSLLCVDPVCELEDRDYLSGIVAPVYPSIYKNLNLKFEEYQDFKKVNNILDAKYVIKKFYEFYATIDDEILLEWLTNRKKFILDHFSELFPDHKISKTMEFKNDL